MPMPWEFDPATQDGRGAVTRSDRARMALKFVFVVVGMVWALAGTRDGDGNALLAGIGIAVAGSSAVDLLWLTRGDYEHTLLNSRRQAIVLAAALLVGGVVLAAIGLR